MIICLTWLVGLLCVLLGIYEFVKNDPMLGVLWLAVGVAVAFVGQVWKKRKKINQD
ncbi:MAG: hypothetical protein AB1500_09760 [Bacillota bacterium]